MSATYMLCVVVPVRIESEANGRQHWRKVAARKKHHRHEACLRLRERGGPGWMNPPPNAKITLTRIAPRTLDDDNLASGFKATRDGVADWLGIDDGDNRLTWNYAQRKGKPGEYAAEIVIEVEA
jgi:hypothetical protein